MKYYSAIKRNTLLIHITTWMNLQRIIIISFKKPDTKGEILYDSRYSGDSFENKKVNVLAVPDIKNYYKTILIKI